MCKQEERDGFVVSNSALDDSVLVAHIFYNHKTVSSLSVLCHDEGPFPGSERNTNVQ